METYRGHSGRLFIHPQRHQFDGRCGLLFVRQREAGDQVLDEEAVCSR